MAKAAYSRSTETALNGVAGQSVADVAVVAAAAATAATAAEARETSVDGEEIAETAVRAVVEAVAAAVAASVVRIDCVEVAAGGTVVSRGCGSGNSATDCMLALSPEPRLEDFRLLLGPDSFKSGNRARHLNVGRRHLNLPSA